MVACISRKIQFNPSTLKVSYNAGTSKVQTMVTDFFVFNNGYELERVGACGFGTNWKYEIGTRPPDDDIGAGINDVYVRNNKIYLCGKVRTDEDSNVGNLRVLDYSGTNLLTITVSDVSNVFQLFGIVADGSGNIYTTGTSDSDGYFVYKYNSTGTEQWHYEIGQDGERVTIDANNNIYVVGGTGTDEDSNLGDVRKINTAGVLQWCTDTLIDNTTYDVTLDSSGNVYIAGVDDTNVNVVKLNNSGTVQWSVLVDSVSEDCNAIAVDSDDYLYVITEDNILRKVDPSDGSQVWETALESFDYGRQKLFVDITTFGEDIIVVREDTHITGYDTDGNEEFSGAADSGAYYGFGGSGQMVPYT